MTVALLDAGPLVALFDSGEIAHRHYRNLLMREQQGWYLTTTWPCVVEASYFLQPPKRWQMLQWVAAGGATIFPFDPVHVQDMAVLMQRYTQSRRAQMDFADASLVWAAGETGIQQIWTLDVRDFYRYRLPDGRSFEIL
jgi:predicted nucleic acid-binding protein